MFEILKSVERSYSIGSTLILLATIWAGLAVLSYKNKRILNFYIELIIMGILYLISFVLLISAIFYEPFGVVLKLVGHTLLIAIALIVIRYAPLHHNKNI
ncbi:hypothetical protein SAMN05216349_12325 [Oribacterium sp. KHPX15]|uniref:hypothetical protein n=1 Tax=Oribacterium sp. KHPX15 TaxID=1855342 RepID=UPI00089548AF|nr:hypothetical protein [Oribacterium sp. KHPX15]SEA69495.1 hypothetical protein SAMN05216349_12325 [Oribacterium sp. KHPX15]